MKQFWLVLSAAAVFFAVACTQEPEGVANPPAATNSTDNAGTTDAVAANEGTEATLVDYKVDGKLVCPVMGDEMSDPSMAVATREHEGVRYYLCCEACVKKWDENPAEFAKPVSTEGAGETSTEGDAAADGEDHTGHDHAEGEGH